MPAIDDPEKRLRQLLGLNALGCRLEARDGHIWIEENVEDTHEDGVYGLVAASGLGKLLRQGGVVLNNKIYGGVLEALDTVDAALRLATQPCLSFYADEDRYFLGEPGVGQRRVNETEPGEGGIC